MGSVLLAPGSEEWGWWVLFVGLLVFCALAAPDSLAFLRRGMEGLSGPNASVGRHLRSGMTMNTPAVTSLDEKSAERQLLEAIDRHGEITPIRAALETSLTVAEADRMLSLLAKGGHLEVQVEGGKLLYSL